MNELQYQKLLIQVIKAHGGFAFKSANRFLIGVADLFFVLPNSERVMSVQSGFLEAKLNPIPVRSSTLIHLDTTVKQQEFLRNVQKGGARGAVMSFIRDPKRLGVTIVAPDVLTANLDQYRIGTHQQRAALVWETLEEWLNEEH